MPALQRRQMHRNLAEADEVLAEVARQLGVTHDLADRAPGHPAST